MANYLDASINQLTTNWKPVISEFQGLDKLNTYLTFQKEIMTSSNMDVYPPPNLTFNCFNQFNVEDAKVVILGLDPYIRNNQAMGLSFSVPENVSVPPSLRNIFKEINRSMNKNKDLKNGDLTEWAKQGVLLMNTALTVNEGRTGSHKKEWDEFTQYMFKYINEECQPLVFMLWGRDAEAYHKYIDENKHFVLVGGHPSPMNRSNPFIGNNHFVECNKKLREWNRDEIDW